MKREAEARRRERKADEIKANKKVWDKEHRAEISAYRRGWRARNPRLVRGQVERYRAKYPEKRAAQNALFDAVRRGDVVKQGCRVCGGDAEAHHADYSRPLDVEWLCRQHHVEEHLHGE